MHTNSSKDFNLFRRLLMEARPFWGHILLIFVGERGMSLSGGERQRISIARAFLKNAPILILDEPTSALDVETETTLMDAMERLMQGRTSLTIAHRLSTVQNCDWRLHFDEGRVEVRRANQKQVETLPNEALA